MSSTLILILTYSNPEDVKYLDFSEEYNEWELNPKSNYPIIYSLKDFTYKLIEKFIDTSNLQSICSDYIHNEVNDYCLKLEIRKSSKNSNLINIDLFYFDEILHSNFDDFEIESTYYNDNDITPQFYSEFATYIEGWDCDLLKFNTWEMMNENIKRKVKMELRKDIDGNKFWERKDLL